MPLVEREPWLDSLQEYLREASAGAARIVLISGEAGIGKSTLVHHFCDRNRNAAAISVGACDGLFTPRALGPLFDLGRELGGRLYTRLREAAPREDLLEALLDTLQGSSLPNLLVLEDVHWADDATLDLILLLARRLRDTKTLLILTFRDNEVAVADPLRVLIGDLATLENVRRLVLPPLTEDAVRELIGDAALDAAEVRALTGGNPFYVTEVIATGDTGIPATVVDAVLSRTARLSSHARATLSAAALIGRRVEPDILEAIVSLEPETIEECLGCGVLRAEGNLFLFSHELARRAIASTMSPPSARSHHALILRALKTRSNGDRDLARLAHHAEHARDASAVLKYAPEAAANAAAMGAHREAAEQYARALRFGQHLDAKLRAQLLERRSYECYLTNQLEEAVAARQAALDYWRVAGIRLAQGDSLRWLSRLNWYLGQNSEAHLAGRKAIDILEDLPESRELAMAYSNQSQLEMLRQHSKRARYWGEKAIAMARRLGAQEIVAHALNNIGAAELREGKESSRALLEKSLEMARAAGLEEHVARAYTNLASSSIHRRDYARGERYLNEGISYCTERDLDSQRCYMLSERTRLLMDQGRWQEAEDTGLSVLGNARVRAPITRITALAVVGLIRARRDEPYAEFHDEALELAAGTGELQRLGIVRAARAEAAWLRGALPAIQAEAEAGYRQTLGRNDDWCRGQLAFWMWRGGASPAAASEIPEPFRLHIQGRFHAAAAGWSALGCPYEAAVALAESGDDAAMKDGFAELDRLGASATSRVLRGELKARGVGGIPRGPKKATRSNVMGLTARESEVLSLLEEGLTNAEIAARLSLSRKTVGHHVSAILGKLGVTSRGAAAVKSREFSVIS